MAKLKMITGIQKALTGFNASFKNCYTFVIH